MSQGIWIEVDLPITDELVHDFRNFGEDVCRALESACYVSIQEIDLAENAFGVWDIPEHALPEVLHTIKRLLYTYDLHDDARLVRVPGSRPYCMLPGASAPPAGG